MCPYIMACGHGFGAMTTDWMDRMDGMDGERVVSCGGGGGAVASVGPVKDCLRAGTVIGGEGTTEGVGESPGPCASRLSLDWGWSCDWTWAWAFGGRSTISTGDASAGLSLSWSLLGTSTVGGGVSLESIRPIASIAPPSMSVSSAIDAWDDMAESAEAWRPAATADPDDEEGAGSGE
jgi:hypothetical protein